MAEMKEKQYVSDNAQLMTEWNWERNIDIAPTLLTLGSNKKVWWKCSKGHEWQAVIANRSNGRGCPYCSGRYAVKGENDLQTVNPTLAKEWNYEKNGGLTPANIMPNSNKKVWWRCRKGHEWQAKIANRNNGDGCPVCNSERHTSFPEYALVYYLRKYGLEAIHLYRAKGYELDIYIPSMKIAIEYDGYLWHKNKAKQDLGKNYKCAKDGIKLYRIREGLPSLYDSSIDYIVQKYQRDLSEILEEILSEIIGNDIDVDIERDAIAIENLREYTEKDTSFLLSSPEISLEWNYEKNGNLRPENFTTNSNRKVWWKCSKGHEWQAIIANRNKGIGCPYCSGRYVIKGENDLQAINPVLAKEWNYERNGDLKPENYTENSGQKVWWKCAKGHEWQARIADRNRGRGCPYCSGRYVVKGENDLRTINPTLAEEWNYEKNDGLMPENYAANSRRKVWWKCNKGHEWQTTIDHRNKGTSCPICSRRKK